MDLSPLIRAVFEALDVPGSPAPASTGASDARQQAILRYANQNLMWHAFLAGTAPPKR